jgi:4-alpha-glucanotransferase
LPYNYVPNCAVYTGTHDNDTARGWFESATPRERAYALAYLDTDATNVHWAMIRAASASVARIAIFPMQDVMNLGAEARMNTPGSLGHWIWRFDWAQVGTEAASRLAQIASAYGRAPIDRLKLP